MTESDLPPHVGDVWEILEEWEAVLEDMESTVRAYRSEGWEVLEVHPGDVTPLDSDRADRFGLDVLIPDNELETVESLLAADDRTFDAVEVYRQEESGHVLLLVVLRDPANRAAVAYPAYYEVRQAKEMLEEARERGELFTHLRNLADDRLVSIRHEDPDLLTPG